MLPKKSKRGRRVARTPTARISEPHTETLDVGGVRSEAPLPEAPPQSEQRQEQPVGGHNEIPEVMQTLMNLVREQQRELKEIQQELRKQREAPPVPVQVTPLSHPTQVQPEIVGEKEGDATSSRQGMREFKRLSPSAFLGTEEPIEAERWISEMQKIFAIIKCKDDEKVAYATFMLQGDAYDWWQVEQESYEEAKSYTWEEFKAAFLENYFPSAMRAQKEAEFVNLKQGNRTVAQYAAEFVRLSRYAPGMAATESARARKFEEGLRIKIKQQVATLCLKTYRAVVDRAIIAERTQNEAQQIRENQQRGRTRLASAISEPNMRVQTRRTGNMTAGQGRVNSAVTTGSTGPRRIIPQCPKCQKRHPGECRLGTNACFVCGQPGHKRTECPRRSEAISGACHSCGQLGHRAIVCPQKNQPVGTCYVCGDPSHKANVCPQRGLTGGGQPMQGVRSQSQLVQPSQASNVPSTSGAAQGTNVRPRVQTRLYTMS